MLPICTTNELSNCRTNILNEKEVAPPHAQASCSLDPRGSPLGGRSPGGPAVRGQHPQGTVPSHLLPLGAEDIAKECGLLQHPRGGDPRRASAMQGVQAIKKRGRKAPSLCTKPYTKPYTPQKRNPINQPVTTHYKSYKRSIKECLLPHTHQQSHTEKSFQHKTLSSMCGIVYPR